MNPEVQCRDWRLRDKKIAMPQSRALEIAIFIGRRWEWRDLVANQLTDFHKGSHVNVANSRASRRSNVADTRRWCT